MNPTDTTAAWKLVLNPLKGRTFSRVSHLVIGANRPLTAASVASWETACGLTVTDWTAHGVEVAKSCVKCSRVEASK